MERFCYSFELLPGTVEEYEREHQEIWAGVEEAMRAAGISNYTLFRRGLVVTAYGESDKPVNEAFAQLDADTNNAAWSSHIRRLMRDPVDAHGKLLFAMEMWRLT